MMQKLFTVFRLIRLLNGLMTILSIFVFLWVAKGNLSISTELLSLVFICFLSLSAGNVINDIYDVETDRINRPNRPLVSGQLNLKKAWSIYIVLITVVLGLMTQLSALENTVVILNNILLYLYSSRLKSIPLIGNATVAYLVASVFILIGIHIKEFELTVLFSIFAFSVHLIRELVKDLADLAGDKSANYDSFPIRFGISRTHLLISIYVIVFSILQLYLIQVYHLNKLVLIAVILVSIIPGLISVIMLNRAKKMSDYDQISQLYKMIMFSGLLAFILIRI